MPRRNSQHLIEVYIMQKTTFLVLTVLVASVASATDSDKTKTPTASNSRSTIAYISPKFDSHRFTILNKRASITKRKTNFPVSSNQATSSTLESEEIKEVSKINAVTSKDNVKPSISITVDIPKYEIEEEQSKDEIVSPISEIEVIKQVPATNVDIPKKEAGASDSETQVLVLKVNDEKCQQLILERKKGQNLDWSFESLDNDVVGEVKAHKAIVFKYSQFLRDLHQEYVVRKAKKTVFPLHYPSRIIQSLVTLLYEHSVTINKSDYDSIIKAAKVLKIDQLIGIQ